MVISLKWHIQLCMINIKNLVEYDFLKSYHNNIMVTFFVTRKIIVKFIEIEKYI